mgnify:CR=1 FL=1
MNTSIETNIMRKLHDEANKSCVNYKHAATITKNSKRSIYTGHNTKRTRYRINNNPILNCSFHAEMSVLHRLLKSILKPRKKKYCLL